MLFGTASKLWGDSHCFMIPNVLMRKQRLGEVTERGRGRAEVERSTGTSEPMFLVTPLSLVYVFLKVLVQVSPP